METRGTVDLKLRCFLRVLRENFLTCLLKKWENNLLKCGRKTDHLHLFWDRSSQVCKQYIYFLQIFSLPDIRKRKAVLREFLLRKQLAHMPRKIEKNIRAVVVHSFLKTTKLSVLKVFFRKNPGLNWQKATVFSKGQNSVNTFRADILVI